MKIRLIGIVLDLGLDLDHGYDRSHDDDDDHTIIRWETVRCLISWFMDGRDNYLDLGDDRVGYDYHGDGRCSL